MLFNEASTPVHRAAARGSHHPPRLFSDDPRAGARSLQILSSLQPQVGDLLLPLGLAGLSQAFVRPWTLVPWWYKTPRRKAGSALRSGAPARLDPRPASWE